MTEYSIDDIDTFGEVAAEDDAVLEYFLSTESVKRVEDNDCFLILGRKGAGKTAIVKYFTEGDKKEKSVGLKLGSYPWKIHASRIDKGASEIEAYVASWRYLVAIEIAAWTLEKSRNKHHDEQKSLEAFLTENYGRPQPRVDDIIRPKRLKLKALSVTPSVMGNQLGGVSLEREADDMDLGQELEAVTQSVLESSIRIFKGCGLDKLYIHFDELDHGLDRLDSQRAAMITGLILAIRDLRRELRAADIPIYLALYLRTDIWDDLNFSDKNKITQTSALHLEWDRDSLRELINVRIRAKLDSGASWDDIIDDQLMRGSQQKWNHIIARSLRRPRDVIQFLNVALRIAKKRKELPRVFTNKDIVDSRNDYYTYLKKELDDEIMPHWPHWEEALQACSAIATETFYKDRFIGEYQARKSADNEVDAEEALRLLHRFSVIGYETRSGYGGSGWAFLYEEPEAGWDSAARRFKVHPGLKEYAKLREERLY